ncbi:MAG: hypothetical protein KJZ86_23165 [Caldilineaceae bacterium]|nr:hypothetical protein [Caldilineaceae bacterium]HRJ42451.1 hypothetical protein [Caldilineaceae bacterium]
MQTVTAPQTAFKYDATVSADGQVILPVPLRPGARVMVFVMEDQTDLFDDLLAAAQSSLGFWDNAFDDEEWNDA